MATWCESVKQRRVLQRPLKWRQNCFQLVCIGQRHLVRIRSETKKWHPRKWAFTVKMAPYRITRSRPLSTPHSPRTCVTPLFLLLLFWTLYFPLFLFEYFQNRHGTSMSSLRDVGVSLAARCFIVKCAWSTSNDKTFSTKNNKVKEETVWHLSSISFRRMAIFAASCSSFFQKKSCS